MQRVEGSRTGILGEHHPNVEALKAVQAALERPEIMPELTKPQHERPGKPAELAVVMRLASEAVATAAKSAHSELCKLRERLEQSETRARAAEERADAAERQLADWALLLSDIRQQILGKIPKERRV